MVADEPRWSVAEAAWKDLLPDLPDEVIALLAAPVVASVDGPPEDEDEERYPSPTEPCATAWRSGGDGQLQPYGDRIARFLAPGEAPPVVPV